MLSMPAPLTPDILALLRAISHAVPLFSDTLPISTATVVEQVIANMLATRKVLTAYLTTAVLGPTIDVELVRTVTVLLSPAILRSIVVSLLPCCCVTIEL